MGTPAIEQCHIAFAITNHAEGTKPRDGLSYSSVYFVWESLVFVMLNRIRHIHQLVENLGYLKKC